MGTMNVWSYFGINVYPAERNSAGIRWYARIGDGAGTLRADTKKGMRELIRRERAEGGLT
jgi:hypothetical protein